MLILFDWLILSISSISLIVLLSFFILNFIDLWVILNWTLLDYLFSNFLLVISNFIDLFINIGVLLIVFYNLLSWCLHCFLIDDLLNWDINKSLIWLFGINIWVDWCLSLIYLVVLLRHVLWLHLVVRHVVIDLVVLHHIVHLLPIIHVVHLLIIIHAIHVDQPI